MTITDQEIQDLIRTPKVIVGKTPKSGYKEKEGHRRCDLDLEATSLDSVRFKVFVRQNLRFIENFSIGLRYKIDHPALQTITLVRYNGPPRRNQQTPGRTSRPTPYPPTHCPRNRVQQHSAPREPSRDHGPIHDLRAGHRYLLPRHPGVQLPRALQRFAAREAVQWTSLTFKTH